MAPALLERLALMWRRWADNHNRIPAMMTLTKRLTLLVVPLLVLIGLTACKGEHPKISRDAVWIDVRTPGEFSGGSASKAINIPFDQIAENIAAAAPDKNRQLILFCQSGRRAAIAAGKLAELGYSDVVNLRTVDNARKALAAGHAAPSTP